MVEFLPFPGFRPELRTDETIEDRISPPYDVIGPGYLARLQGHEGNVTNLTLRQDADGRYHAARQLLDRLTAEGGLKQDADSFYLYRHTFDDQGATRVRTGIVGILRTEDYAEGGVIPHEETFSAVKEDRLNLLRDVGTHLESIFGIFEGLTPELNRRIASEARLVYRYVDDQGVEHRYLRIGSPEVCAEISRQLRDQSVLIADGHHRYETALNYARENPDDERRQYVLATLVASDDEGLVIWPTHRLVDAPGIGEEEAIAGIGAVMDLAEVTAEELEEHLGDHLMGLMFRSGRCFLADHGNGDGPLWDLDTYVAQELILKGVYRQEEGMAEVGFDAEYPSVRGKMEAGEHDLAIVLNNPSLQMIWDLSLDGMRMPKKTTYFHPKIWSGFVFYRMD
jgi:uncharacterized protein (DUF1015 family)